MRIAFITRRFFVRPLSTDLERRIAAEAAQLEQYLGVPAGASRAGQLTRDMVATGLLYARELVHNHRNPFRNAAAGAWSADDILMFWYAEMQAARRHP